MGLNDEIRAFLINGKYICFNCYDPDKDKNKEDGILTADLIAEINQCFCERCKGLMIPDRRCINRRDHKRRYRDVTILAPDRRGGQDRRSDEGRRKAP